MVRATAWVRPYQMKNCYYNGVMVMSLGSVGFGFPAVAAAVLIAALRTAVPAL